MSGENITHIELTVSVQQLISTDVANHYGIVPKEGTNDSITFYISKDKQEQLKILKGELQLILNKTVSFKTVHAHVVKEALSRYYRVGSSQPKAAAFSNSFLDELIFDAKRVDASDIHIEIFEDDVRIRLRIDGKLIEKNHIKKDYYLELINQIKIKSNLDITEKRLPQDGRIEYDDFDIRVSILPTHYGEKVVMRILGRDASHLHIEQLGFESNDLQHYLEAVRKSNGIVLISGPTGSGKTTTLYATLKQLNTVNRNIVTVEDPIEYTLKGINQVQLKENIGLTFAKALKSFLRQDPDIIMLGEIRDAETAQMAIRASLTGHLVLSTIHTNSAIGTISRLIDMGVPPFLIAETINISVAQRLLRTLCNNCKAKVPFNENDLPLSYEVPKDIKHQYIAKGCYSCYHTGYKGRQAIYEILPIDSKVLFAIKANALDQVNGLKGKKLSDKAFNLFSEGVTSLDEVYPLLINSQ